LEDISQIIDISIAVLALTIEGYGPKYSVEDHDGYSLAVSSGGKTLGKAHGSRGSFGETTYSGHPYEESGANPSDLSDTQLEFLSNDNLRHVLITSVESPGVAARWNNNAQSLVEGGRDAHFGYGAYTVYPGDNLKDHLKTFTEGAFRPESMTGMVCSDWNITKDMASVDEFEGKSWGVEILTEAEKHFKASFEAQLKSIVMLKNIGGVFPLKEKPKAYVPERVIPGGRSWFGREVPDRIADCLEVGGNGYVPISLQYGEYTAEAARENSIAGGSPFEDFTNRSYHGKTVAGSPSDADLERSD
jgi:hypothetical protein